MKISTRISIIFSIVSSVVLIAFGLGIYQQSKSHTEYVFNESLKKRIAITERFFLEKNSFSISEFEKIKTQFLHTLPQEKEEVIKLDNSKPIVFQNEYSSELKVYLLNETSSVFKQKESQGASKIFRIEGVNSLIIVTAVDELGISNLKFLFNRIILFILIGVLLLFILFMRVTKDALRPISKKIEYANKISATNLDQRLKVENSKDEIGQMAIAFNNLLDRLEKSFESQKSFISNASHEIKNPLTAIMGEAEIASSRERTSKEYLESFSIILNESERLNLTVNNLLQLSKVNAIGHKVSFEKINISCYIIELIESYSFVNPQNNLSFKNFIKEETIFGNKSFLKTVIINLFDNACKFSNNDIVEISITTKQKSCILMIKDFGIGIPKKDIESISNPFYRASNTLSIKGSGIGLALSKKIVELHNGILTIDSKEGEGTTITVCFLSA